MSIHIGLSQDYEAVISQEDADLADYKWCAHRPKKGPHVYAVRNDKVAGKRVQISLSRTIMQRILGCDIPAKHVVDYRNRNTLDCTRENLRLATYSEIAVDRSRPANVKRPYKGVKFRAGCPNHPWIAVIKHAGRYKKIGQYATPEEARDAYRAKAIELYGEFGGQT